MADWTYLVADLRTGAVMAELPLSGVRPVKTVGDAGTFGGTLTLSPRLGVDAYSVTTPARTAVYALRDGQVWWGGIVWTRRYASSSGTVELGGADWWSYFDHRKILPIFAPDGTTSQVAGLVTTYTGVEQNQLARNLVALAQSHTAGDIGIQLDASATGTLRDRTYRGYELTDVGEALRQLSQVEGGPDIMFDSTGPDSSGLPVRVLRIGTPTLGQMGSPHVLEWGGNITGMTWPSDGTRMVTRQYAVGEGIEAGQLIAVAEESARYADGWPLLEAEQGYSSVSDPATLQGHATADQAAARLPVVLPDLTVVGSMLAEVSPGDDVRVIFPVGHEFFAAGLDTRMRVISVAPTLGDDGQETASLTVSPLLDDVT